MIIDSVYIDPLLKAFAKFEQFRVCLTTEQEQAGAIQAFEYCFELVWKIMKRLLAERSVIVNSPREVFRAAAQEGLIDNPEQWFIFLKMRNLTVHTYEEEEAREVLAGLSDFAQAVKQLLTIVDLEGWQMCF